MVCEGTPSVAVGEWVQCNDSAAESAAGGGVGTGVVVVGQGSIE